MRNFALSMKKTVIALYIVVIAVMAIATIVEKYQGTSYVSANIYGAWWFSLLWAVLTAFAIGYFIKQRVRKVFAVALHLSFVIILLGALLTHLTAEKGIVYLRTGVSTDRYMTDDMQLHPLPFAVRLDRFEVKYHEGTSAAADYVSTITMDDGKEQRRAVVSMNNIASFHSVRLYQSSFDEDMQGSVLAMNSDPWGIPVTYLGYALLFLSLIWMLFDPKGMYRKLLRSPLLKRGLMLLVLFHLTSYLTPLSAAPRVLPQHTAEKFGQLFMVYNDRVCPVQTYAIDFTKKLYGKRSYQDYTAEQVLTGYIFFYGDWADEPVLKVKGSELKQRLRLPDYGSMNYFFGKNGYILGPYIREYYQGFQQESFHKEAAKMDEKIMLIMELHKGTPLKLLPYQEKSGGSVTWFAPTDNLPATMDAEHQKYIREVFTLLNGEIQAGNYERADAFIDKMLKYQQTFGRQSLPTATQVEAEHIYNKVAFATILFMVCLTMGILSFLLLIFNKTRSTIWIQRAILLLSFLALSFCLALRWIITGNIPMSNGYETMLFLAWSIMLMALIVNRWFSIMLTFGFLLSGFFLLVSHISQMDPQISHLMPVLNSPLLTIHVSVIMMSFAFLAFTCICGITAFIIKKQADELKLLSQLFLFPAITCLGLGIFIGAIWANVSWGTYWSWDPKETWALITFMIYSVGVHEQSLPFLRQPKYYHTYMVLAFLTILMTYFGVNYFLGGMHSYA